MTEKRHDIKDKGFTLIELLVVIIIIGIIAAIAIPSFLNQRQKGYDASVKSGTKSLSTSMETYYSEHFAYPTTQTELETAGFNRVAGVRYSVFVKNGADSGYVIFAKHDNSDAAWALSTYNGGAVNRNNGTVPLRLPTGFPTSSTFVVSSS